MPSQVSMMGSARTAAQRYRAVRAATTELCAPLAIEDYVIQSMPEASPSKWHLAHTSWFFEEFLLQRAIPGYRSWCQPYRFLFNSYYNCAGPMHCRAARGMLSRPTVAEISAYRSAIDERLCALLEAGSGLGQEFAEVLALGIEHERQHQELLLCDLKHLLSLNPLHPVYRSRSPQPIGRAPELGYTRFDGGVLGIGHSGPGFCFDNELPPHERLVAAFRLANRPVTNGEFLEFVRDGVYRDPSPWLADGWALVQREGWRHPIYWEDSLEREFTLAGLQEIDPQAPVCHVSYYEADAFARWAGARLPTEFEWEAAAAARPVTGNFLESGCLHPRAACTRQVEDACAATGPLQLYGDVWEWTQSAYEPYPGYRPARGALGEYNGKFMVNQLVLRGGSCATPGEHLRSSYRNFFPPAARWQFAGLRLAACSP